MGLCAAWVATPQRYGQQPLCFPTFQVAVTQVLGPSTGSLLSVINFGKTSLKVRTTRTKRAKVGTSQNQAATLPKQGKAGLSPGTAGTRCLPQYLYGVQGEGYKRQQIFEINKWNLLLVLGKKLRTEQNKTTQQKLCIA